MPADDDKRGVWVPTVQFRWFREVKKRRILQQLWRHSWTGHEEWRAVLVVDKP